MFFRWLLSIRKSVFGKSSALGRANKRIKPILHNRAPLRQFRNGSPGDRDSFTIREPSAGAPGFITGDTAVTQYVACHTCSTDQHADDERGYGTRLSRDLRVRRGLDLCQIKCETVLFAQIRLVQRRRVIINFNLARSSELQ